MKVLHLLITFLFINSINAQDFKLIEELKFVKDKERVAQICNTIIASAATKYRLFTTKESFNAGILRLRYVPAELSDADLQAGKFTEEQRLMFITIDFSFYNAGEDVNAVRPEVITYKFNVITANYVDLFPIWKKFFKPEATFEETKTDVKLQHLKDRDKNIDLYITQTETGWALRTM